MRDMTEHLRRLLQTKLPQLRRKMAYYLGSPVTHSILFKPIKVTAVGVALRLLASLHVATPDVAWCAGVFVRRTTCCMPSHRGEGLCSSSFPYP